MAEESVFDEPNADGDSAKPAKKRASKKDVEKNIANIEAAVAKDEEKVGASSVEEAERIIPDPDAPVKLANGLEVDVKPLRLREFLSMLKIITRGAAMSMGSLQLNTGSEDFMQSMLALFIFAIPEAEDEACAFVRMMVVPANMASREAEKTATAALDEYLYNPELDDLLTIIETVIRKEGNDLQALGKRLAKMLEVAQKTGRV